MKVTLSRSTPKPIDTIAEIASICYDSAPKSAFVLVKRLYESGHHSVFEHVYFTFKIEGISRACSHQLVRHRMCAFTQRSQRYCSEDGFSAVVPSSIQSDRDILFGYADFVDFINDAYETLQEHGVPKEDARYVLPNACKTSLYLSCNLRELIHIANERLCKRAQWEIREVVQAMCDAVPVELHFMLQPKCKSGFLICNASCNGDGKNE